MSELDIVFLMLRTALGGGEMSPSAGGVTPDQWWRLFRLMQQNHVAALCCEVAMAERVPREVLLPWLAERTKATAWQKHQRAVTSEIIKTMQRHGIETMVLKGTHASEWWSQPELREFGDVDLYFHDRHAEADRVAERELGVQVRSDSHHHTKYDLRGVTIESHFDFLNRHYPPSNRRYEAFLKENVGSATFDPLFLLRHMAGHFASGRITLRDLCDWVFLWRDHVAGCMLERQCEKMVAEFGMLPFAAALHVIAEQRLGMWVPDWGGTVSEALVSRLEHDIVYGSPEAEERGADGISRLPWKLKRWNAMRWKRQMVYAESEISLILASIVSHAAKPRSILHKM